MKPWLKVFISAVLLLSVASVAAIYKIKRVADGYLYGYPLLIMEQSRLTFTEPQKPHGNSNQFRHVRQFPDHTFRNVVRPNNDTLYSIAWIDLTAEPLVLSVPDTNGRYYVMPLMDAWSNVFAMIGRRTTGTGAGDYVITGPDWLEKNNSELPANATEVQAPSNMVWLIGRIQTNGVSDIATVNQLQNEFSLTPLSQWNSDSPISVSYDSASGSSESPMELVESLDADAYFSQLAMLLGRHAASEHDAEAQSNLASLGVIANTPFERLGPIDSWLFNTAIKLTQERLTQRINNPTALENGWAVHRAIIGNYGTDYRFRAAVAKVGLGALPAEEAAYPNTKVDSCGEILSGDKRYKIHFSKGQTPPADAFWSLSLYDQQGFFINNSLRRYSIGDRDQLTFNDDGSLDIYIQNTVPDQGTSNWLPSPSGNFELTMRLYSPKESFLSGQWQLPEVVQSP